MTAADGFDFDGWLEELFDPIRQAELTVRAAYQTEYLRTDPWTWYCRVCGDEGEAPSRQLRDEGARYHVDTDCRCSTRARLGWSDFGRSLHVWRY